MKLRTKIKLFSSLFMLTLIILVNTSVYFLYYKISADNELEQVTEQTNAIVEALQSNKNIPVNELLHAFVPAKGMIRIVDLRDEEIIPTITKDPQYRELDVAFSEKESQQVMKGTSHIKVAVVTKPIIWENGKVVTLQVANYLVTLNETMQTLLYVLIAASLLMFIPAIIAGNVLSKFVLTPIIKLIDTMKENTLQEEWKTIDLENKSQDELYEMEDTFNKMIHHLKENFDKQEVFVSDASHELKTPISIIKSYAQLLKRRGESHPEVFEESVEAIESEADRMQHLVNQLLDLAKSKHDIPYQIIKLEDLALKVMKIFQQAYHREINFHSAWDETFVYGNEDQLEQVIYILLDNARRYSESEINISIQQQQNIAVLQVMDKGPGISDEDQLHIFDRFYRADKSRARQSGGTGLGLSIARSLAQLHGGELIVTSEPGKGSIFTLRLPVHKQTLT